MAADDTIREGFGLRLKAARERKGLTQQQVADAFSLKKATVSAWETGGGMPDALRLARLAKMYDVSADALLWDDALTNEAMQFAAQFDALTDQQQRTFRALWLAYFEQAKADKDVEASYGLPPKADAPAAAAPPKVAPPKAAPQKDARHKRPPSRYVATDKPGSPAVRKVAAHKK
jgi:transcriptional regulator with XRE-family HTH domain